MISRCLQGAAALAVAAAAVLPLAGHAHAATAWQPDAPVYDVVEHDDVPITMADGVVLRANVGIPVPHGATQPDPSLHFPVLVSQTPYRKDGGLFTVDPYFVQRGYAMVVVDVRGTGSSQGQWDSFGPREQEDGPAVVRWAAHQPWANGIAGLMGASYLAINQLLTMEQPDAPTEVKAIFPVVPMSDAYRDVTFHGGDLDAAFIPPWLGLVTALGAPPAHQATDGNPADAVDALQVAGDHAQGAANFQVPQTVGTTTGSTAAYDGDFYQVRSPIRRISRVTVPTFVVGGEFDIFQRGEPLIYSMLPTTHKRLILGPWVHLQGSTASTLPADGIPDLKTLELQWFDQYLRGQDAGEDAAPPVLQYRLEGVDASHFVPSPTWPMPGMQAVNLYTAAGRTGSAHSINDGALALGSPHTAGTDALPATTGTPCSRTTFQWGDASGSQAGVSTTPCETDERVNEVQSLTYTTPALSAPLTINGPINVHLVAASLAGSNVTISVRVTDVAPDGRSTQITSGFLLASLRAVQASPWDMTSNGIPLRVFHPFTQASEQPVPATPTAYDVEVFPTFATFQAGHRLRLDVATGDTPHLAPSVPHQAQSAGGVLLVSRGGRDASRVALPVIGGVVAMSHALGTAGAAGAATVGGQGVAAASVTGLPMTGAGATSPVAGWPALLAVPVAAATARRRRRR